jgi:hypothetical protein
MGHPDSGLAQTSRYRHGAESTTGVPARLACDAYLPAVPSLSSDCGRSNDSVPLRGGGYHETCRIRGP